MDSDIFSVAGCGIVPGSGYGEPNTIALQHAIDQAQAADGGTVYLPAGEYEFARPIHIEVNSSTSGRGSLRIRGAGEAILVQADDSNLFVITDTDGERGFRLVELDGLHFGGNPKTPIWAFEPPTRHGDGIMALTQNAKAVSSSSR
jgi:hypothetical protein